MGPGCMSRMPAQAQLERKKKKRVSTVPRKSDSAGGYHCHYHASFQVQRGLLLTAQCNTGSVEVAVQVHGDGTMTMMAKAMVTKTKTATVAREGNGNGGEGG